MSRRAKIRSERVSLRVFEGGREEVDIEESMWRNVSQKAAELKEKGRVESTGVGEVGRVFVVVEDGTWLRSIEVGVFDFFEFDHFCFFFFLYEQRQNEIS